MRLHTRNKKQFIAGFFALALIVNMTTFTPRAHAWWTISNIFGTFAGVSMDEIIDQIKVALVTALKASAVKAINGNVGKLIGGNSTAEALFVTDWDEFLHTRPEMKTRVYVNDFLTTSFLGKGSDINYAALGNSDADLMSDNYPAYLMANAAQAVESASSTDMTLQVRYDLDQFAPNPQAIFETGDIRALNAMISNPMNNVFGATMMTMNVYNSKLNQTIDAARTEASSSGFIGKKDPRSGKTIAPAATIDKMLADTQDIGNKIVAAANDPGLVSTIITAMINRAVNNLIQKGVGKIQANIDREIQKVDNQIGKELDRVNRKLGPAAKWLDETNQKTNVINAYTSPPPSAKYVSPDCGDAC